MSRFPTLFLLFLIALVASGQRGLTQVPLSATPSNALSPNRLPPVTVPANAVPPRALTHENAHGSNPLNVLPKKTYRIEHGSANAVQARMQMLMPEELKRFTFFFVDEQANTLTVQGPPAALEMAEQFIPRTQRFVLGTTSGTFSPMTTLTYQDSHPGAAAGNRNPANNAATDSNATFLSGKIYRCSVQNVRAFRQELQKIFGADPAITFDFDLPSAVPTQEIQVSFLAPENVQPRIAKTLYDMGVLISDQVKNHENIYSLDSLPTDALMAAALEGSSPSYSQAGRSPIADSVQVKTVFTPQRRSIGYMDQTLRTALGKRMVRINSPTDETSANNTAAPKQTHGSTIYEVAVEREQRTRKLRVELDYNRKAIFLEGDKRLSDQMRLLIETIDKPSPGEGMDRKIITIRGKHAHHIRKFAAALALRPEQISSWKQSTAAQYPIRQVTWKPQQPGAGPTLDTGPQLPPPQFTQPGMGQFGAEQFGQGQPGMGQFAQPPLFGGGDEGQGFDVPQSLQINVIPELDIILFEGTNADSKRLQEMIADIEKMMDDSKSKWAIVQLEHTDCISMNDMLYDMYYLLLFRQKGGQVNLFPLRNPNALLVVGWGTAYDDMLNLIKVLDKPISQPGSTWKVIRLRYVSATYASNLIRELFQNVPNAISSPTGPHVYGYGWMPRIRATADVRTNSLIVHAGPNDIKEVEQLMHKIDLYESGPEMRIQKFPLKNSLAADVSAMLTNILTPGTTGIGVAADQKFPQFVIERLGESEQRLIKSGIVSDFRINADPQHNVLYITAPEYAMPLIAELIELIDSPMPVAKIRMIPLYNGDAEQMMQILTNLIIPQQLQGQLTRLSGAQGETNFVPLRFSHDVRSNTIIAVGSDRDLDIVEAFIWQLDKEEAEKRMKQVYQLKNAQAEDVARAIELYVRQKREFYRNAPGVKSPFLQIEEALIVVPEAVTNSLLIEATPKYFDEILEIIEDFDRQPDQVVIQALIAEITCSNADEFGAEFGIQDSILFNRSSFDSSYQNTKKTTVTYPDGTIRETTSTAYTPAGDGSPGFAFGDPKNTLGNNLNELSDGTIGTVAPQLLTNFNTGRVGTETGFGGLVFSASSDSVSILIRALQERKRLEVLSRPQITAMDNQMAFILVGQRVPRVGGTSIASSGAVQGDVQMEEVGLMLMVTPRISPDGKVMMNIGAEKSSVGSLADGIPIPSGDGGTINSPKISAITTMTNVCASNNETVMLGGLLTKDTENVNRRVPYLADIPVLGRLFQYRLETIRKTELIIILTPRIIKHTKPGETSEDAALIKREEAARIHWCLNDVLKMHASSTGDIGIWDSTADKPVAGTVQPIYPRAPVNRDELKVLAPNNTPSAQKLSSPLHDSMLDLDLSTTDVPTPQRLNPDPKRHLKTAPTPAPSNFNGDKD